MVVKIEVKRLEPARGEVFSESYQRLVAIAFLLVAALGLPLSLAAQDLLLHSGKVVTADAAMTVHEAVAVEDGRIVAVGRTEDLLARYDDDGMPKLDLEGRTVLPGLVDSHVHALCVVRRVTPRGQPGTGLSSLSSALPCPLTSPATC